MILKVIMRWVPVEESKERGRTDMWHMLNAENGCFLLDLPDCANFHKAFNGVDKKIDTTFRINIKQLK